MSEKTATAGTPAVSILMPVYNAIHTLEAAVASVQAQTVPDWELLLADDASTDGSGALCDRLAAADPRICVHHQPQNGGAGPARNAVLAQARGEYVMMMDSDDTIDPDLLEQALSALREHGVQTVVWGVVEDYTDASGAVIRSVPVGVPAAVCRTPQQVHEELLLLETHTLLGYGTNKLYRRDVLQQHGILSVNEPLYEDFFFNADYAQYITSLAVLPTTPYHYYKRGQGLTARFVPQYFALSARRVERMWELCREWDMTGDAVRCQLGNIYARYIFSALQRHCDPRAGMDRAARRAFLQGLYDQPLFCDTVCYAAPPGRLMSIMCRLLQRRRTTACLLLGRLIYWVKNRLPALFRRVSH